MRAVLAGAVLVAAMMVLPACKPTYKKGTYIESVKILAKKEYGLDVEAEEVGTTLAIRFRVKNLLSEMYSGSEDIYKKMNGLFMVLVRVGLSSDIPPQFVVLEIIDEDNPQFRLVFTRYMEDVRKSMADGLSYTQTQDRLLQEFVIGDKRVTFDPNEMDLVRLMMMAMDTPEPGKENVEMPVVEVQFSDFIARVAENYLRRLLRDNKDMSKEIMLRKVSASFDSQTAEPTGFKILLDLVSQPAVHLSPRFLETQVLPLAAKEAAQVFQSYRFKGVSDITVVEKNSGKILTVPAK